VIVTADHGENLGEGGLITHALSLDERLIHVPFVAAGPGAPDPGELLSLAVVPRLVAAAAGIDGPWAAEELPAGVALAQQVAQLEPGDPRIEIARREWSMQDDALARFQVPLAAATDGRWKLLSRGGDLELYDLGADLLEERPLPPEEGPAAVVEHLRSALGHPAMREARGAGAERGDRATDAERADIEERMRLLGYL
jgi:arylsulfatase A-like enzyme